MRFTQDVDIVLRREDLGRATEALARSGFVHRQSAGIDMFLDIPGAKARDAVRSSFLARKSAPNTPPRCPTLRRAFPLGRIECCRLKRSCG